MAWFLWLLGNILFNFGTSKHLYKYLIESFHSIWDWIFQTLLTTVFIVFRILLIQRFFKLEQLMIFNNIHSRTNKYNICITVDWLSSFIFLAYGILKANKQDLCFWSLLLLFLFFFRVPITDLIRVIFLVIVQ